MNTEDSPVLSLFNVCGGCADERFQREVSLVLENLIDPNTDAEAVRAITMEFKFRPFKDRSGANVELTIKSKMTAAEPVTSNVFLTRRHDEIVLVPFDPKQERLFDQQNVQKDKSK